MHLVEMRGDRDLIWAYDWISHPTSWWTWWTNFALLLGLSCNIFICGAIHQFVGLVIGVLFFWWLLNRQPQWTRCDPDVLILFHL